MICSLQTGKVSAANLKGAAIAPHQSCRMKRVAWRLLFGVLCATLLTSCRVGDPGSLYNDPDGLAEVLALIRTRIGEHPRVLAVAVDPGGISVKAQDPANRHHVDEWRTSRRSAAGIYWDRLSGPSPVSLDLLNPDLEANLFDLDDGAFTAIPAMARAALVRAKLDDAAQVTRMEMARPVYILPSPSSGPARWSIHVSSGRESAQVYADLKGNIVAADLANTNRAKTFDMLKEPASVADAVQAFRASVGSGPLLVKVAISAHSIGFQTNIPDKNYPLPMSGSLSPREVYTWNLSGLHRALGSINADAALGVRDGPFGVDDADWSVLPKLFAAAKEQLGMPKGQVTDVELKKPTEGVGTPKLLWTIEVTDPNREKGRVVADVTGAVKQVTPPESRRAPIDWYDPATMVAMLERIGREFGDEARFAEIMFMDDKVVITARDPRQPGELAQILLTKDGFTRFGTPSMLAARSRPFALAELTPLTATKLAELEMRTLKRLTMPPRSISSITLGRGSMDPSPRGNVTIEIRAEEKPFGRGGRINYELDGTVLKAYLP